MYIFFFSSRRRHTRLTCDWSSDVCSSDLATGRHCIASLNNGLRPSWVRPNARRHSRSARNFHSTSRASRPTRSEERRVGKECRSGGVLHHYKKKEVSKNGNVR